MEKIPYILTIEYKKCSSFTESERTPLKICQF